MNKGDRNEATTRLHLLDTLMFDCLGWSRNDAVLEDPYAGEYTDYTFSAPRPVLIVEAKKEGDYFELPAGSSKIERSIPNLCKGNVGLKSAMEQVAQYCQSRGVPFGLVSNGHQLVAFLATRNDGIRPLEGKALVYPSLDKMMDNYLRLWNELSKPAIEGQSIRRILAGDVPKEIPHKLSATIPGYPGVKLRNIFQANLQTLSELTIEDILSSEDLRDSFLSECYIQSGSLSQYALISKGILQARYSALFASDSAGPAATNVFEKKGKLSPELVAKSFGKRPILLLGDVGVGKTTFINYLIHVDAAPMFEQAITFVLNLGTKAVLAENIKEFVVDEIIDQLLEKYEIDVFDRNFVAGTYFGELDRFRKTGIYSDLRKSNPDLYTAKEIEFLEEKIKSRERHLKYSLAHIAKIHKKQIVVFLDNVDQREENTQQLVFLISQEIAENWSPVTVFVTLRPETFYRSSKLGAISGYHPKAFTILPPRIDSVIIKRLEYARKITDGQVQLPGFDRIEVNLKKLSDLITVFLYSLNANESLVECIDNVAGGNVRLALDLVRGFLGSGHVDTEKIIDVYTEHRYYNIPLHEFLRAIIYGDAEYFMSEQSPVANLFDVSTNDGKEHFLLPLLLGVLDYFSNIDSEEGFIETVKVYEKLQALGYTPEQVDLALLKGYRRKLFETAAGRIPQPGVDMPPTLRINTIGAYHIQRLSSKFAYVDAMIVDTAILDRATRDQIHNETLIEKRLKRATLFRKYLDTQWNVLRGNGGSTFLTGRRHPMNCEEKSKP